MKKLFNILVCALSAAVLISAASPLTAEAYDACGNIEISAEGEFTVMSSGSGTEPGALGTVSDLVSGVKLEPEDGSFISRITVSADNGVSSAQADITVFFEVDCFSGAGTCVSYSHELMAEYLTEASEDDTAHMSAAEQFVYFISEYTGIDASDRDTALSLYAETELIKGTGTVTAECYTTVPEEYEYEEYVPAEEAQDSADASADETAGYQESEEIDGTYTVDETESVPLNTPAVRPVPDYSAESDPVSGKVCLPAFSTEQLDDTALSYGKRFTGWKIVYPNGMQTSISENDSAEITIVEDVQAFSLWTDCDVCVITATDINKVYDGTSDAAAADNAPFSVTVNSEPVDCTISGYTLQCSGSDVTDSGEVSIVLSEDASLIWSDGSPVFGEDEEPYLIVYPGRLTVTGKELSVTTGSAEKVYDGTALTNSEYSVDGLAEGDELAEIIVSGSLTASGECDNSVESVKILNGNGADVSGNYNISLNPGTLEIKPASLTISTGSAEKVYDGTALTSSAYSCDGLAEGDELAEIIISGTLTATGKCENSVESVKIVNGSGADVSGSYNISWKPGTLEVKPATVTVTAVESSAEYDGKMHSATEFSAAGLASGDVAKVSFTGGATYVSDPGVCTPECSGIVDANGNDVSSNYADIVYETGKITIVPRKITISTASASKNFDGDALECREFSISSGSLAEGDRISVLPITGRQIYVGSGKNTVDLKSVVILNSEGKDVTSCYSITVKEGTLTVKEDITKLSLTIKLKTGVEISKVYDAKPLTISADDFECTGLPAGYRCSLTLDSATVNATDCGKTRIEISSYVIYDGNGKIVGSSSDHSFNVSFDNIYLEILPRDITITAASATKVYDGSPLTCHKVASAAGSLALDTHTLNTKDIVYEGSQTEVGTSANKILSVVIRDSSGKDVTSNYNITFVDGSLTVAPSSDGNGKTGSSTSGSDSGTSGNAGSTILWGTVMLGSLAGILFWFFRRKRKE